MERLDEAQSVILALITKALEAATPTVPADVKQDAMAKHSALTLKPAKDKKTNHRAYVCGVLAFISSITFKQTNSSVQSAPPITSEEKKEIKKREAQARAEHLQTLLGPVVQILREMIPAVTSDAFKLLGVEALPGGLLSFTVDSTAPSEPKQPKPKFLKNTKPIASAAAPEVDSVHKLEVCQSLFSFVQVRSLTVGEDFISQTCI